VTGSRSDARSRWWELTVAASFDTSEALTNLLWELGALGVLEEETPGTAPYLRAFFPDTVMPAELQARVADYVEDLVARGFPPAGVPKITPVEDENWATAWREYFQPVPIGRRLVVVPPWNIVAPDGRLPIVIDPGRAFGTGHHGSTAGCLVALESLVDGGAPARALDLGTGSGVLAIAAVHLGVGHVLAIDEDPDAISSAVENARRNGVAARIRCVLGNADEQDGEPVPLVLANLLSAAHHRLAAHYARLVASGGALILGGILDDEAEDVARAVARAAFVPGDRISLEGWTTLVLTRAASPARDAAVHVHP
jgi:ribosomal protein L11 methyltransferase